MCITLGVIMQFVYVGQYFIKFNVMNRCITTYLYHQIICIAGQM